MRRFRGFFGPTRPEQEHPEIGLNEPEEAFVSIARELFGFLEREWGCRVVVSGAGTPDIVVLFLNRVVGIEITFMDEARLMLFVLVLRRGKVPPYFGWSEPYRGFDLDEFILTADPSWKRDVGAVTDTPEQIEAFLRPYAEALRLHGGSLMRGDPVLLDRMRVGYRRHSVDRLVQGWSDFVNRVERGIDGSMVQYYYEIEGRNALESMLSSWKWDREHDPLEEIAQLDRRFEAATERVSYGLGAGSGKFWRKPREAFGQLREDFARYASKSSR